jgi:DNA repair protein RadA/Sms
VRRICACCDALEEPAGGGWCRCGASTWIAPPAPPKAARRSAAPGGERSPVFVRSLEGAAPLIVEPYAGELAQVLGGILRGGLLLLAGDPGAGKSTLAAELATAIAGARGGLAYWLDREQDDSLVRANIERVGQSVDRVRLVSARPKTDPDYKPITWAQALALVPMEAPVLVLDSLQAWARSEAEQRACLEAINGREGIGIVINRSTKAGDVAGALALQYDGDATIVLSSSAIDVLKCRWLPGCPRTFPRADRTVPPARVLH